MAYLQIVVGVAADQQALPYSSHVSAWSLCVIV